MFSVCLKHGKCLKTKKIEREQEKKKQNAFFYYYFLKADNKAVEKMAWKAKGAPSIKVYTEEEQKKKRKKYKKLMKANKWWKRWHEKWRVLKNIKMYIEEQVKKDLYFYESR